MTSRSRKACEALMVLKCYLITIARLSLTNWLTHPLTPLSHVPKAKHIHSAKIKGLACISLQSFPGSRVVKVLDCRSDEDVRADLIPVMEHRGKRERWSEYEVQSPREQSDREYECKAQSLREQSDRECKREAGSSRERSDQVDVPEWAKRM